MTTNISYVEAIGVDRLKSGNASLLDKMVGERGFEPPAPASRRQCSTRLSYSPTGASGSKANRETGDGPIRRARGERKRACQSPLAPSMSAMIVNFSRGLPSRARAVSAASILRQSRKVTTSAPRLSSRVSRPARPGLRVDPGPRSALIRSATS